MSEDKRIQQIALLMLSATSAGEIVAARDALVKLLKAKGRDIHEFIERTQGLSEEEMTRIYTAGYEDGKLSNGALTSTTGDFVNIDGTPNWHEIARFCQRNSTCLGEREREFINSVTARSVYRPPTEKQEKWLRAIFFRMGGQIPPQPTH